ncbi:Hsp33 family molecular chaperone HslO [Alkalimarinus alittae]|uniref:33 kDa chaperonin n=1 Tax=Alkalimarinus alittae TaxID=2961619 RepID=A0ABY6N383_9ALTE|nr:Hsp33 family molecular chaperone HslO [Alkalimarinus alittae]UZE96554.1 Hsp33 family molecular chaperone HslO [Alkalimarinus alittae]
MKHSDTFQRFLFDNHQIRGELVRLNKSFKDVKQRKEYPAPLQTLIGEALAASVLMSGTLKFEGILSVQARGDGAVKLLMAECTHDKKVRAIGQWEGDIPSESLTAQLGAAQIAITIDPTKGQRYQGIVPLEKNTLADCLIQYFEQSEQLSTLILLFCDQESASGLFLQQLPARNNEAKDSDAWNRLTQLASTLTADEIHKLDGESLLKRLYHEEEVTIYPEEPVQFECSCSKQRTASTIISLGQDEIYDILAEQKAIEISCQFCNELYRYEKSEIDQLFGNNSFH